MAAHKEPNSLPYFFKNIYVILCHTSHPGNLGAAARAMKTMGLSQLILVAPNIMATPLTPHPPIFDPQQPQNFHIPKESFTLAAGAKDTLSQAKIFATLKEATLNMHITCALTSRRREIAAPLQTPKEIMPELIQRATKQQQIALIFGSETFGLSIEEVSLCNRLITINGNPDYFSLNLAQAVQVISYELFSQLNQPMDFLTNTPRLATRQEVTLLVEHLKSTIQAVGFFEKRNQVRLMRRLQRTIDKIELETEEVDILRGFLNFVNQRLPK